MTADTRSSTPRLPASERREQILETATRIFARKGFEGTTTKDLAKACGVSESALYKHFPSKEAIFENVLQRKIGSFDFEHFLSGLPQELGLPETLETVARKILDIGLADPLIQKLFLAATLAGSPEAKRFYLSWRLPFIEFLERRIRIGIERGEIRDLNPQITARAFVGLVNDCVLSCTFWDSYGYGKFDKEKLIANNIPVFVRGMLSRTSAGSH
ncbi:MAG: TetR/AcrR family transcriptional regulator [Candidatus Eisenbacteria bacterium]